MADEVRDVKKSYKEIFFTVPWGVIAAKAWGSDDGKPFLGLHGWLDNANTFDRLAPLLPTDNRFIAIDFPGHGRSSHRWPGMPYIYFEYVADVKKVVSQLGWENFSIIGHSMGSVIGALYAGTFPNEVHSLTCLDMGTTTVHVKDEVAGILAHYATKMSDLKKTTPRVYHSLESTAVRRQETNLIGLTLHKEDAMLLTERGTRITEDGLIFSHDPMLKGLFRPFTEPQSFMVSVLSNTQCEVLVLESTEYVQFAINTEDREHQLEKIRMICQNAKCKVWKEIQGGHHFHMEKPKEVAQEIKDFLNLCRLHDQPLPSKL